MAYPATEVQKFRAKLQGTVDALRQIEALIAIIEDQGENNAALGAFFNGAFGAGTQNEDLTFAEFVAGATALKSVKASWDTHKVAVSKLLPK